MTVALDLNASGNCVTTCMGDLLLLSSLSALCLGPEIAEVRSTLPHLVSGIGSGSFTCLSLEELLKLL